MSNPTKESFAAASNALRMWASTTSSNNLRKSIAREIDAAKTCGYMEGYEAGKRSIAEDKPATPSAPEDAKGEGVNELAQRIVNTIFFGNPHEIVLHKNFSFTAKYNEAIESAVDALRAAAKTTERG